MAAETPVRQPRRAPAPIRHLVGRIGDTASAARAAGARAVAGDRPLVVMILLVTVVALMMLSGPFQSFLDARERVEGLEAQAAALEDANARLAQRAEDLRDPRHLELLAREQQGMIMPGEEAYVVVPPEVDRPRIAEDVTAAEPDRPWYRTLWESIRALFA